MRTPNEQQSCSRFAKLILNGLVELTDSSLIINVSRHTQEVLANEPSDTIQLLMIKLANLLDLNTLRFHIAHELYGEALSSSEMIIPFIETLLISKIEKLSITVLTGYPQDYMSRFSVPTAEALLLHGRQLTEIDVQVNDIGALAFLETCRTLSQEALLNKYSIRPIKEWNQRETLGRVDEFSQDNLQQFRYLLK